MNKRNLKRVLYSMLIGDGYMYRSGNRSNLSTYFSMTHCQAQRDYLEWKVNILQTEINKKTVGRVIEIKDKVSKCGGKHYPSSVAVLGWKEIFNPIYEDVYPYFRHRQKSIEFLLNHLSSPLELAIWLGDDGNEDRSYTKSRTDRNVKFKRSPRYRLGTYGFTDGELNATVSWFQNHYRMTPRRSEQAGGEILRFHSRDSERLFRTVIHPYFSQIESMKHKFRWSFEKYGLAAEQGTPFQGEDTVQTTTG